MSKKAPYQKLAKLPPPIEQIETIRILKHENLAIAALSELKGIAKLIPNQEMLINAIVIQESKDSSEIENIITSQDELYKALTVNQTQYDLQVKEVIGYRSALNLGFNLIKKNGFISINNIIKIQKELILNNAGIRKTPGTVLKNDQTGEIVYTPPQGKKEIEDLLTNFIKEYNNDKSNISPLTQLAILHYQFESIHPFYDGNGRTGRILNVLYLLLNNLLEIPILYLSSYITKNKAEYYRLLNHTNKTQKWEDWIIYMLKAVEQTSIETIDKITSIKNLLDKTINQVKELKPKIYKKELVELLFEQPYSKIDYVVKKLKVERKAASRYLKSLEEIKILKAQKIGRETIYVNIKLMKLLKK